MSYIVPVHKPSGVRFAIKLNLLSANEPTLVVAKANRLDIYTQSATEGLTLVHSRSIYGYISMLSSFRPAASSTDHLFVGTDRYQYFTCSWHAQTKTLRTEQSYVDQADKTLRNSKESDRCHIDPTGRYMTLELYDGVVSVTPFVQQSNKRQKRGSHAGSVDAEAGTLGEPVQVRIEETLTRDSTFLDNDPEGSENPRLAILWEDNSDIPQLKLREIQRSSNGEDVDLVTVAELRADLDAGVSHLIPVSVPYGGFLILGERSIAYADAGLQDLVTQTLEDDNATIWTCWTKVDDTRWLLADDYGRLFFLMLEISDGVVAGWKLDSLGQASKAACVVYLDEGLVFVGSHSGDSQVVRIIEGGLDVLQTFQNLAPIMDFTIMDLGRGTDNKVSSEFSSGQARVVAAAGAWQDGTIRGVRSGVGMEVLGAMGNIPLINDLWALSSTGLSESHDVLLASFYNESRVFQFDSDANIEEVASFNDFDLSQPTILAANLPDRTLLQVHEGGVEMADVESHMGFFDWKPADAGAKLTSACANGDHVVVVENGLMLHVFHVSDQTVWSMSSRAFSTDSQISGVTILGSRSNTCIISHWQTATLAILDLHTLETVSTQSLGDPGRAVPRSVLLSHVLEDAPPTLFVAMADGTVVTFAFNPTEKVLTGMTRILLGTEPVVLKPLPQPTSSGTVVMNIFASCEQPSLIYASEGRIIYSAVNADKSSRVCQFNSEAYPGAVALASPDELMLAMIGTTRTTQLQTLNIGETVRCLAYAQHARVFGLCCIRRTMKNGTESLISSVKLADEVGFNQTDSIELGENELVECIVAVPPMDNDELDESTMFVVGTSMIVEADAHDPPEERGRILVYRIDGGREKLELVAQSSLKGACRSLAVCDGFIIAGLVKVVALYNLLPSHERGGKYPYKLDRLATYRTSTNPLAISVQQSTPPAGPTIAVADLMKSLSVLTIVPPQESSYRQFELKEVSRHFANVWSSSTAVIGDNEWVLADMEGNIITLRRNTEAVTNEEQKMLEVTGEMRLGEVVNKIVPLGNGPSSGSENSSKGKERSRTLSSIGPSSTPADTTGPASRTGSLIQPQAFLATVEGAIYMMGAISAPYVNALLRLQAALATRVQAPGHMPWARYRAFRTDVREADEPFRFVDGEMVEAGLLGLSDAELGELLRENGLTDSVKEGGLELSVGEVRAWGEELRRLY